MMSCICQNPKNVVLLQNLLTSKDVARILNISRSYAFKLMRQGDIPVVQIGRSVRVRAEDLEAFILANIEKEQGVRDE
jgi:excisionase family DNA binding protein